ncbi:sporulation protein YtrH [Natranaerovirga hydrolytica]|uniref:Sporulation protein YtrH n=1 Tax=Natranaerovirga hydrolytica TaxID=680378 RepID=A0A4R1MZC7_9FIRM|nr:YtrH family sporulation protein [Natranaerovirga hydrolytica]TCK98688.1 sporulation protein YtrH [Natranaerovirga hydrolytica]
MNTILSNILYNFLIAFGMILGASVFSGFGAILNNQPPLKTMLDVAQGIKIWAVAAAIGGTFTSFEIFESSILKGELRSIVKQVLIIVSALVGANFGFKVVQLLERCGHFWLN